MNQDKLRDLGVFALLVVLGVLGRWSADLMGHANFTPAMAVALFGGFYFASRWVALAVPVAVLAISNTALRPYDDLASLLAVYAFFLLPVALGWLLQRRLTTLRLGVCAVLPAIVFFLVTNFAWLYPWYERSWSGIVQSYVAGVPFLRSMLLGDVLFTAMLFGAYQLALATNSLPRDRQPVRVPKQ